MALFDKIVCKKENFKGYTGNPPSNEAEYNSMKADMFNGTAPTWSEIQNEMNNYIDPLESAKVKLSALGLNEEEIKAIIGA